jgi:hypothetical protein
VLQGSHLTGLGFREVYKEHIVRLHWEKWDPQAEPARYPASGEPEDYLLKGKHSPTAADEMGPVWSLGMEVCGEIQRATRQARAIDEITLILNRWDGRDFFLAAAGELEHRVCVTEAARTVLLQHACDWITLVPAEIA